MAWDWKKAGVVGVVSLASTMVLSACSGGHQKEAKQKTIIPL